jgi:hypothetical protein
MKRLSACRQVCNSACLLDLALSSLMQITESDCPDGICWRTVQGLQEQVKEVRLSHDHVSLAVRTPEEVGTCNENT